MSEWYKVMCCYKCCISAKRFHSSLLSWRDRYLSKLNDLSQNTQKIRSGENANSLFDTYKTLQCHMGVMYMQHWLTWPWLKCVHIHHLNIHFHTGNVCCVVVIIAQVSIFQTKNHIGIIPTHLLQ